jgi:hypothetical protein
MRLSPVVAVLLHVDVVVDVVVVLLSKGQRRGHWPPH